MPIEATTISELMEGLFEKFPTLKGSLAGEDADVMAYTNVYINDVEASEIGGLQASLSSGDTVTILPSMAGGYLIDRQTQTYSGRSARSLAPF